ncbi:MAG: neutral/alkaline non-lysosomal ceramidase N-terminal domain-containing protein, partial [Chloroflexota bacterium]|nr:neutral/alkaline non-lysosomal ceramidase N-terminal domain-containing protein [Chloroflexota bacterium]
MGQLRAGVGRVSVTPAIDAWLVGFAGRASGCTSIHDELYATALVLDDGDSQVAILSCDLISIHPQLIREVRALVRSATGIEERNVMICCTHTHSGPPGYATPNSRAIDRAYAADLPFRLAGAVRLARDNLVPARLGHAGGETTIAINRREVTAEGKTILGVNPTG